MAQRLVRAKHKIKAAHTRCRVPTLGQTGLLRRPGCFFQQGGPTWTTFCRPVSRSTATRYPILLARSRHASVRCLERYARPSAEAVARHVAEHDPAR